MGVASWVSNSVPLGTSNWAAGRSVEKTIVAVAVVAATGCLPVGVAVNCDDWVLVTTEVTMWSGWLPLVGSGLPWMVGLALSGVPVRAMVIFADGATTSSRIS